MLIDAKVRSDDALYRALKAHDRRFDGVFFVGVSSTGIYCRPVCRVRLPKRENCNFFQTAAAAEGAGYRPCLQCRPERAPGRSLTDATHRLATVAYERITAGALNAGAIATLASDLCVSERQLRRAVKQSFGVSPVQLAQARRNAAREAASRGDVASGHAGGVRGRLPGKPDSSRRSRSLVHQREPR